jgi:hypothetical protein
MENSKNQNQNISNLFSENIIELNKQRVKSDDKEEARFEESSSCTPGKIFMLLLLLTVIKMYFSF